MSGAPIFLLRSDAVAEITLNRPEAKNSLRLEDFRLLDRIVSEAAADSRCILIGGAGGAFSAGRDLKETDPVNDDTEAILADLINPLLRKVYECEVPTIAAVEGPALGFGLGLALACDIAWVADNAILGSPFGKIGAVLDSGGHFYMKHRIGPHRASELIYTGRLISGREAAHMGLVNRSCSATDVRRLAREMAEHISAGPTGAFRASKTILRSADTLTETLAMEAKAQTLALSGPDGREGIAAFKEKRRPCFVGR